jgi:hypothetical protein
MFPLKQKKILKQQGSSSMIQFNGLRDEMTVVTREEGKQKKLPLFMRNAFIYFSLLHKKFNFWIKTGKFSVNAP